MKELISRAQSGCPQSRLRLVEALRPRLCSLARHYARKGNLDYEDLLQEAWCAVFTALPETRLHIGSPEQFLLKRARWAVLDYLKWSLRRQMQPLEDDYLEAGVPAQTPLVDLGVALDQVAVDLTPIQQRVMQLLLAGDTCTSAAARLGCTTANVSYHLGQVRRAVEKAWVSAEASTVPV